jgi:hypothetical protein
MVAGICVALGPAAVRLFVASRAFVKGERLTAGWAA